MSEQRYLISVLPPALGALSEAIGDLNWKSEYEINLQMNNKRDYWLLNIDSDQLNFFYGPATADNAHGQYNLGMMYLEGRQVLNDRDKAVYWIEKAARNGFGRARHKLQELSLR